MSEKQLRYKLEIILKGLEDITNTITKAKDLTTKEKEVLTTVLSNMAQIVHQALSEDD